MPSVAGAIESEGEGRPRRRWGAIAASVLVHAAVLAVLGLNTPELRLRPDAPSPTPPVQVRLEPPPPQPRTAQLGPGPSPAPPQASAAPIPPILHRPPAPELAPPLPTPPTPVPEPKPAPPKPSPAPVLPAPRPSAAPGAGAPKPAPSPGQGSAPDGAAAMRAYGRSTVGCDAAKLARLTAAERDRCNQRFGEEGRKGVWTDPIPKEKREAYDLAAETTRKCRHYDTPVQMQAPRDRNYRIEPTLDARTPESQHKESKAVLPDDGLLNRWNCWFH